jgi:hypothetical protein
MPSTALSNAKAEDTATMNESLEVGRAVTLKELEQSSQGESKMHVYGVQYSGGSVVATFFGTL